MVIFSWNKVKVFCIAVFCISCGNAGYGAALTSSEITQIENDLGIILTSTEKTELASLVKPDAPLEQWRIDAEARIETHRKADITITVVDTNSVVIPGAVVAVTQMTNAFKFSGILNVKDFHDDAGNLQITTNRYQQLFLNLFNSAGLNNGLKPKLRGGFEGFLPTFFSWAQANNLPVRGHALIWPGNVGNNHLPDELPDTATSYSLLSKVEALEVALTNGSSQVTIDALTADLKSEVDYQISDWASQWDVFEWDVINETRGNFRVQDLLGNSETAAWFNLADSSAVQSDCKLMINENQIISARSQALHATYYTERRDIYKTNINYVVDNGGSIDRIGFQSRFKWEIPDPVEVYNRLEEFNSIYSLEMVGTEFEIPDGGRLLPVATSNFSELERAQITEEVLTTYYSHPLVTGLNAWTYMNDETKALCSYDGAVKLNGLAWYYLHRIRYNSSPEDTTDASGEISFSGFYGSYEVTVTPAVGAAVSSSFRVIEGDSATNITVMVDTTDVDTDSDGLPDAWEQAHQGNLSAMDAGTDSDLDGILDVYELNAGTSPTNANKGFRLIDVTGTSTLARVTWDSDQDGTTDSRSYDVYRMSGSVTDSSSWSLRASQLPSQGAETVFEEVMLTGVDTHLYRIAVHGFSDTQTPRTLGVQRSKLVEGTRVFVAYPWNTTNATVSSVFGLDQLPAATTEAAATLLEIWDQNAQSFNSGFWLSSASGFEGWNAIGTFNNADNTVLDLEKGIGITLRSNDGPQYVFMSGMLPTNNHNQVVQDNGYTLVSSGYPTSIALADSGLIASGFTGGTRFTNSDQVYLFNPDTGLFDTLFWYDTGAAAWIQVGGASGAQIEPGTSLVIFRRNRGSHFTWQQNLPYSVPVSGP